MGARRRPDGGLDGGTARLAGRVGGADAQITLDIGGAAGAGAAGRAAACCRARTLPRAPFATRAAGARAAGAARATTGRARLAAAELATNRVAAGLHGLVHHVVDPLGG